MEIGRSSQDPRLSVVPLRETRAAERRSESISTVSQTSSSSSTKSINIEEPVPNAIIIQPERARAAINNFRLEVILDSSVCAISGKGKFWAPSKRVGPGVEAKLISCHKYIGTHTRCLIATISPAGTTVKSCKMLGSEHGGE